MKEPVQKRNGGLNSVCPGVSLFDERGKGSKKKREMLRFGLVNIQYNIVADAKLCLSRLGLLGKAHRKLHISH